MHGHDLIAQYATLPVGSILGEFVKRLEARWVCPDTYHVPRPVVVITIERYKVDPSPDKAIQRAQIALWLCHFAGVTDGWPDGWSQLTQGRRTSGVPIPVGIAYPVFAISVCGLRRSQ